MGGCGKVVWSYVAWRDGVCWSVLCIIFRAGCVYIVYCIHRGKHIPIVYSTVHNLYDCSLDVQYFGVFLARGCSELIRSCQHLAIIVSLQ